MANIWITSDTHFNHYNIIEYCNRPFSNVDEMNKELIKRWNSVVKKNDKVWHLGDFFLGKKDDAADIISHLNGNIYLIKGNHDIKNQWYNITIKLGIYMYNTFLERW